MSKNDYKTLKGTPTFYVFAWQPRAIAGSRNACWLRDYCVVAANVGMLPEESRLTD
jgi:hypothetical protein